MYEFIASIVVLSSMWVSGATPAKQGVNVSAYVVKDGINRTVYQYTSRVSETDGSPCISANGWNICEYHKRGVNICAANFVPFGTKLYVEDLGVCIVADRMNSRYKNAVDWYNGHDTPGALQWGKQKKQVNIVTK